jgi:hypothetical protein
LYPAYPGGNDRFLIEQGIFGRLFDDIKDKEIDRAEGHGYRKEDIPKLYAEAAKTFFGHYSVLPDLGSKWRNTNFIALALFFQAREKVGLQDRT